MAKMTNLTHVLFLSTLSSSYNCKPFSCAWTLHVTLYIVNALVFHTFLEYTLLSISVHLRSLLLRLEVDIKFLLYKRQKGVVLLCQI